MIVILYTAFVVLFLFGMTVFVHELGHFLVARRAGMVIETFSIGFGPAIWRRKIRNVTYKFGLIPFGGYVALPQMDPSDRKSGEGEAPPLPRVAPAWRIAVALAGAAGAELDGGHGNRSWVYLQLDILTGAVVVLPLLSCTV